VPSEFLLYQEPGSEFVDGTGKVERYLAIMVVNRRIRVRSNVERLIDGEHAGDVPNASIWLVFLTALLNSLSASVDLSKKTLFFCIHNTKATSKRMTIVRQASHG
jgi:hypothetical protein